MLLIITTISINAKRSFIIIKMYSNTNAWLKEHSCIGVERSNRNTKDPMNVSSVVFTFCELGYLTSQTSVACANCSMCQQ